MIKLTLKFLLGCIISSSLMLVSCSKKDDPTPSGGGGGGGSTHISGSTEGTVTVDATTTSISGSSTNSQYGFVMYARNMTPANSYPDLNFDFGTRPTKDSTYTINTSNFASLIVGDQNSSTDNYFALSGKIIVDVVGDYFTATVTNVVVTNGSSQSKTISGSVKYYY
jgi:hypothetical protein